MLIGTILIIAIVAGVLVGLFGPGPAANPQVVCPHCQTRGHVTVGHVVRKQGISGGKATGALFTGGVSMLATGLSRKQHGAHLSCGNCGMEWDA